MRNSLKFSLLLVVAVLLCGNAFANQYINQPFTIKKGKRLLIEKHSIEYVTFQGFYVSPTGVVDSIPDSLRNKSKTKTMLLGIFTGVVGGHLWYLGYHKRAMKRTMDGVLAFSLIGLGVLAQYTSSSLLKNFSGFFVGFGAVILLKVLIQTAVELVGISKGKYPKEYIESKEENQNKLQSRNAQKHKGPVKVIEH